jgi:choline dehydrogenase-like flavoprotein
MTIETCDYLIIGGGSAGCILARRLADATRGRIILIEAGKADEGDPKAVLMSRLDDQTGDYDWGFKAAPLPGGPHTLTYSRAKMLGGCANHNDCAFLVPPDSDFAAWETLGAKGWGPDGVRPCFARVEELTTVSYIERTNPVSRAFIDACRELGLPEHDFRKGGIRPGTGWFPLNAEGDVRHSSSVAYLHPLSQIPKHLEIWTETVATQLLIEGRRAVGARTSRGPVRANREVLLACGSIQTPQLMMLSGLGPAAHLQEHGIPVIADLPGVGSHLLDHVAAAIVWDLREPAGSWTQTAFEPLAMMQVDRDAPAPDVLFHFGLRVREKYGDHPRLGGGPNSVKASPNVARARSTGTVRLSSADPGAKPLIDLCYFSDPDGYDMRILKEGMRFGRRLPETPTWSRLARKEIAPGPDVRTDAELEAYIRDVCETVYHPCGTCLMGDVARREVVVSPDLKVKGIEGLRVVDASIFPAMITVNINNTVMMAAEKAAGYVLATV